MPRGEGSKSILLFDGVCNLCSSVVRFTIEHSSEGTFECLSLQSEAGKNLLRERNIPMDQFDSFILVENDQHYSRSTAVLKVVKKLNGLWPLLCVSIIVPKPVRDLVYDFIARNRYNWYGKKE